MSAATDGLVIPVEIARAAGFKPNDENDPCEETHCGTEWCDCDAMNAEATAVLERWHNDTHPGVLRFCDHSPCAELRAVQ